MSVYDSRLQSMRKTEKTRGTRARQVRKGASIQKVLERKRGHPSSTCQRSPILCHISFYLVHKKKVDDLFRSFR